VRNVFRKKDEPPLLLDKQRKRRNRIISRREIRSATRAKEAKNTSEDKSFLVAPKGFVYQTEDNQTVK